MNDAVRHDRQAIRIGNRPVLPGGLHIAAGI